MGIIKTEVVLRSHEAIVFKGYLKAGQHNVPAQEVFLEENGCTVGGCSVCDTITLS